jgi:prepilin-type N-terminal cleavage/methylation domain-containing protein
MVPTGARVARTMTRTSAASIRPAGFTLLELVIVLAILAMGSVLVIPSLSGMSARTFNAQVREAHALLTYTRRTAVVTGQAATARFQADLRDEEALLAATPATEARSRLGQDEIWTARGLTLAYRDSTEQLTPVEDTLDITFFPEGGSTGGALILAQNARQVEIRIDPFSGKVTTEEVP